MSSLKCGRLLELWKLGVHLLLNYSVMMVIVQIYENLNLVCVELWQVSNTLMVIELLRSFVLLCNRENVMEHYL